MTIRLWRGRRRSRFWRLCSRAPRMTMSLSPAPRPGALWAPRGAWAGSAPGRPECLEVARSRVSVAMAGDYSIRPGLRGSLVAQGIHRVEARGSHRGIHAEGEPDARGNDQGDHYRPRRDVGRQLAQRVDDPG